MYVSVLRDFAIGFLRVFRLRAKVAASGARSFAREVRLWARGWLARKPGIPPWYERNSVVAIGTLGVSIVLTVVGAMSHDLRWLLFAAWFFFAVSFWSATAGLSRNRSRAIVTALLGFFAACGLYYLNLRLKPVLSTVAGSRLSAIAAAPSTHPVPEAMPQKLVLLLGGNGSSVAAEESVLTASLEMRKFTGLLNLGGYHPIVLYVENGVLYADVTIWDAQGRRLVTIRRNKVRGLPPNWDFNVNANAVEVVDSDLAPVFQMIRKRRNVVQIAGLFAAPNGSALDVRPTQRIFKYPSWAYPGQYATAKQLSPSGQQRVNGLAMLSNQELILRVQNICQQVKVLSQRWRAGYARIDDGALNAMRLASSETKKMDIEAKRLADDNQLYESLGIQFDQRYRQQANLLRAELVRRLEEQPSFVLSQHLETPNLLSAGNPDGPDPFADVCEYLHWLASRIR